MRKKARGSGPLRRVTGAFKWRNLSVSGTTDNPNTFKRLAELYAYRSGADPIHLAVGGWTAGKRDRFAVDVVVIRAMSYLRNNTRCIGHAGDVF